MKQSSIFYLS